MAMCVRCVYVHMPYVVQYVVAVASVSSEFGAGAGGV